MKSSESNEFYDTIHSAVESLESKSINYRAIGSVALDTHGIVPVDLSPRAEYIRPIDQHPDLDLLVPRSELKGAREVRKKFEDNSSYPVKIGLAVPSMQVDMRPADPTSYLTYGRKQLEINSSVFDAELGNFHDIPINVVSSETLRHMYGHMSSRRNKKHYNYLRKYALLNDAMGKDPEHSETDPYRVFHEYESLVNGPRSLSQFSMDAFEEMTKSLSPEAQDKLRQAAFKVAGVLKWR